MKYCFCLCCLCLSLSNCKQATPDVFEEFFFFQDHQIHYKISGKGKPVLFLHGGYLNVDAWDKQTEFLLHEPYQCISYSDFGHGQTITGTQIPASADLIDSLTKFITTEKLTLVGLSWGAMLAVDYVLRFPDRVEKLVLVSPGLHGWNYFQDSIARENNQLRKLATQDGDTLKAVELFHQNWVVGPRRQRQALSPEFDRLSFEMISKTMHQHWQADWSKLDSIPAINRLETIDCPTLIIYGEHDAEDIFQIVNLYQQKINHASVVKMDGVAHSLNMENPDEFNQLLLTFLQHEISK